MTLDTTDLTRIAAIVLGVIVLGMIDDPRMGNWIKAQWSNTVGAWFAKRRSVIRVSGRPDEYIRGIPTSRRDINTGSWT